MLYECGMRHMFYRSTDTLFWFVCLTICFETQGAMVTSFVRIDSRKSQCQVKQGQISNTKNPYQNTPILSHCLKISKCHLIWCTTIRNVKNCILKSGIINFTQSFGHIVQPKIKIMLWNCVRLFLFWNFVFCSGNLKKNVKLMPSKVLKLSGRYI